jgi:hypothetical protein
LELVAIAVQISDLIQLEQRLSLVRSEIEMFRRQMQSIDMRASFSSIWLYITEELDIYEISTLWERITKAFGNSVDNTVKFFQAVLIFLVSALIPIVLIIIMLLIGRFTFKRLMRRKK